jgi:K+-sensing histidine kinase KdpD
MIVARSLDEGISDRREPAMMVGKGSLSGIPESALRYGLAILSVGLALAVTLFLQHFRIEQVEFPIFLIAIAITVWYAGTGPAIFALVLASLAFNYYFTEPYYSFYVTRADIPYYAVFILFALLITWFAALRKRVERELIESRDQRRNRPHESGLGLLSNLSILNKLAERVGFEHYRLLITKQVADFSRRDWRGSRGSKHR